MPRVVPANGGDACQVCNHPGRRHIDDAIATTFRPRAPNAGGLGHVAERFGMDREALDRHLAMHLRLRSP